MSASIPSVVAGIKKIMEVRERESISESIPIVLSMGMRRAPQGAKVRIGNGFPLGQILTIGGPHDGVWHVCACFDTARVLAWCAKHEGES